MTNLLLAVTASLLITNTEIRYPTHMEQTPCPDGMLGCLVLHWKAVPDFDPTTRDVITTIERIETTSVRELSLTVTNKRERVSRVTTPERAVTTWQPAGPASTNTGQEVLFATNSFGSITISTNWGSLYFADPSGILHVGTNTPKAP